MTKKNGNNGNGGKNGKKEEPKLRVASAKAGTAKKCDLNYFPPENSMSRQELEKIVDSEKDGVPVSEYRLSEMFLGRLVRCGLVATDGEVLTATKRTKDILSGKIELPSTRQGSRVNQIIQALKSVTDEEEYDALIGELAQLRTQMVERNTARAEEKAAEEKTEKKAAGAKA